MPSTAQLVDRPKNYFLLDFIYASIAIVAGITVAAIAIIISPLFLPFIIQKHKQRSMSQGAKRI